MDHWARAYLCHGGLRRGPLGIGACRARKEGVATPPHKPRSDAGTSLTRRNVLRHGLAIDAPLIPGESLDAWAEFEAGIIEIT